MRLEKLFYTVPLRLRSLFRRKQVEAELDEELEFHLAARISHELGHGNTLEDARNQARQAMQGVEQKKEACRDARRVYVFETGWRNLRYAVRSLRQSPGFTAVTVLTLALGIGANSAIFSLVDTILLKMLPVQHPEQLYAVGRAADGAVIAWSYPDYQAMRDGNRSFSGLAAYSNLIERVGLQIGNARDAAEVANGVFVSGNYFDVLGIQPAAGHLLNAADDRVPGGAPFVILSYKYWQTRFNGHSEVLGEKLSVNGFPFVVVGVAAAGFTGVDVAAKPDLFFPVTMYGQVKHLTPNTWNDRHMHWLVQIGRLRDSTTRRPAEEELFALLRGQELNEQKSLTHPELADRAFKITLRAAARGYSYFADDFKKPLLIVLMIVGLVLLIACANVANLMLARGAARQREVAVRLALGASRKRVISELLTESLMTAVLGGLCGIAIAVEGVRFLLLFLPQSAEIPVSIDATIHWRVVAFTSVLCLLTSILVGLVPACQTARPDVVRSLKDDVAAGRWPFRNLLVTLQVALALPLLLTACLFVRTLANLHYIDSNFRPSNVYIAHVDPTAYGYKGQRILNFYNRLRAAIRALPGVQNASLAAMTPLTGASWNQAAIIEGFSWKSGERNSIWMNAVSPGYFASFGTSLTSGRDFSESENPPDALEMPDHPTPGGRLPEHGGRKVAIVNQAFARRFFGRRPAVGMHVAPGPNTNSFYEIVGVASDTKYFTMRDGAEPMMFIPVWRNFARQTQLVIRAEGSAAQLTAELRREIARLDPVIPLMSMRTFAQDVNGSMLVERLVATLSGFFSVVALLLSAMGLYGVVAYSVIRRTREIGIRLAIGATDRSVLWLVVKEVLLMIGVGAFAGAVLALLSMQAIRSILFGVRASDPLNIIVVLISLAIVAITASLLPARRATRIDPATALRYE